ncbi:MAG: hypothetical protein ACLT5P_06610 [Flavonifractor plautii]
MRHRTGMCVLMMILGLSLSACGGAEGGNRAEQLALDIRGEYLEMGGCTASLELTADYGQRVYTYGIGLNYAREGETTLTITAPENIAGVTARILEGETALEYDGMRVETGPLDDSGMSPVDAVPVLMDYVQEGFIAECGMEAQGESEVLRVVCREPESAAGEGGVLLWFDPSTPPFCGGAVQDGFTVIQCLYGVQFTVGETHITARRGAPAWPFS